MKGADTLMNEAFFSVLRRAGEIMLHYEQPAVYEKSGHANFVTEADVAVQQFLMEQLHSLFPSAAFFAEEEDKHTLTDGLTFIIDPIDGTTNYFRRRGQSMVSVGAVEGKQPVFGAIFDPYLKRMYHAQRGQGAYCNQERLHVSGNRLDHALISFGSAPYNTELMPLTARTLGAILPRALDIRRTGSACMEMCDVAAGRSDAHFEWLLQPWDYCAGTLLIEEAGGKGGNILGGPVTYDAPIPHMACNAACFDELQELLQRVYAESRDKNA